jgi:hypothetical protein
VIGEFSIREQEEEFQSVVQYAILEEFHTWRQTEEKDG